MKHRGIAQRLIVSACGPRVLGPETPIHTTAGRMTKRRLAKLPSRDGPCIESQSVRSSRDLYGVPCYQDQPSGVPAPFITSQPYSELLLQTNKQKVHWQVSSILQGLLLLPFHMCFNIRMNSLKKVVPN